MATHFITGGAGFIAGNLARRLLNQGHDVLLVDDLSLGRQENIIPRIRENNFANFVKADCADINALHDAMRSFGTPQLDEVWHFAANSDIAAGGKDFGIDIQRTFLTTAAVLELVREHSQARIHFASSSAIYGDHGARAIPEDVGPLQPISYYGAMKLASESLLRAAAEDFVPRVNIYRFANIVGLPATHGVIFDFVNKLVADDAKLQVLGDGRQQKPYLHVTELIDAMLFAADNAKDKFNVFNVGPDDDGVTVKDIAELVVKALAPSAKIEYGTRPGGWVGDVPRFRLSIEKIAALGWRPGLTSKDAVRRAVTEIVESKGFNVCKR